MSKRDRNIRGKNIGGKNISRKNIRGKNIDINSYKQQGEGRLLRAGRLEEALKYRAENPDALLIAGGTDLLVNLRKERGWQGLHSRPLKGVDLLDISNLGELKYIREGEKRLVLGALTTITALITSEIINSQLPLLAAAGRTIGSTQIRNRATVGGNICNASPAGDLIPPLLVSGAEVVLSSLRGERILTLARFLTGPYRSALAGDELLTAVRIPVPAANCLGNFQKIGRRQALNISRLTLAVMVQLDDEGILDDCRVVPGAAAPYPCRFTAMEQSLAGKKITALNLEEVGELAAGEMVSITGERWSTPYKKLALATLVRRGLQGIREEWLKEGEADGED